VWRWVSGVSIFTTQPALVGSVPDNAWIGLVGGAICIVLGIFKIK